MKPILKKFFSIFLASTFIFSAVNTTPTYSDNYALAKGSKTVRSSKPSSSKSSKPSSTKSSKPKSSSNDSSSNNSSSSKNSSSGSSFRSSFGRSSSSSSREKEDEKRKKYQQYLNRSSFSHGFFSSNTAINMLLWYTLFNSASNHNVNATDQEKELVKNIKDNNTPVYMLEIKTSSGETKYITVSKEQYDKVKEGDNISIKSGNLEIKQN